MESVEGVVKACNETKVLTDKAFGIEKKTEPEENAGKDDDEIPQIKF
jgi:hypothetical protein